MSKGYFELRVIGAAENNLKNITCSFPYFGVSVVCGPSGCGKSSLLFDTIFAEAKRRFFVLGLNPTASEAGEGAKHFTSSRLISPPKVLAIDGLTFVVGLQGNDYISRKETVATVSGVFESLSLLFYRFSQPFCLSCGKVLKNRLRGEILQYLLMNCSGHQIAIQVPIRCDDVTSFFARRERLIADGFVRVRINGEKIRLDSPLLEEACKEYFRGERSDCSFRFSLLLDSFILDSSATVRLLEALDLGFKLALQDICVVVEDCYGQDGGIAAPTEYTFAERLFCRDCNLEQCSLQITDFCYWSADENCFPPHLLNRKLLGLSFQELYYGRVGEALSWAECIGAAGEQGKQQEQDGGEGEQSLWELRSELLTALSNLRQLGLSYLELNRPVDTLSKGELQRVRLSRELASGLSDVIYLLDEPSRGLHCRDVQQLLAVFKGLTAKGGSVVVADHDLRLIAAADQVVELGPGAGRMGGRVLFQGNPDQLSLSDTLTGKILRKTKGGVDFGSFCSRGDEEAVKDITEKKFGSLTLKGLSKHNLKIPSLKIPLRKIVAIAGVSGSGKSTLVFNTLFPALSLMLNRSSGFTKVAQKALRKAEQEQYGVKKISGIGSLDRVCATAEFSNRINMRSIVATALVVLKPLRELYALTSDAKVLGLGVKAFSFNSPVGWCDHCRGLGHCLLQGTGAAQTSVCCPVCSGRRFSDAIERVKYRGRSLSETLGMSIEQLAGEFSAIPALSLPLKAALDSGLGYLSLSQTVSSLSGGERQRLRIVRDIASGAERNTIFLFDEPTGGLHCAEVEMLIGIFRSLCSRGHSVIAIEHQRAFLANADWIIELGPGAGPEGGNIVFEGTPREYGFCS